MQGRKPTLTIVTREGTPESEFWTGAGNDQADPDFSPVPEAPCWLSIYARQEWDRIAPVLHRQNRLTPAVEQMLENYCINAGLVRECEAAIQVDGIMIGGKKHPAFDIQTQAMKEARILAVELQLTRSANKEEKKNKADGWDNGLLA